MATLSIFAGEAGAADLARVKDFLQTTLKEYGIEHKHQQGANGVLNTERWSEDGWSTSTPMFQEESAIAHIAYNLYASATYPGHLPSEVFCSVLVGFLTYWRNCCVGEHDDPGAGAARRAAGNPHPQEEIVKRAMKIAKDYHTAMKKQCTTAQLRWSPPSSPPDFKMIAERESFHEKVLKELQAIALAHHLHELPDEVNATTIKDAIPQLQAAREYLEAELRRQNEHLSNIVEISEHLTKFGFGSTVRWLSVYDQDVDASAFDNAKRKQLMAITTIASKSGEDALQLCGRYTTMLRKYTRLVPGYDMDDTSQASNLIAAIKISPTYPAQVKKAAADFQTITLTNNDTVETKKLHIALRRAYSEMDEEKAAHQTTLSQIRSFAEDGSLAEFVNQNRNNPKIRRIVGGGGEQPHTKRIKKDLKPPVWSTSEKEKFREQFPKSYRDHLPTNHQPDIDHGRKVAAADVSDQAYVEREILKRLKKNEGHIKYLPWIVGDVWSAFAEGKAVNGHGL